MHSSTNLPDAKALVACHHSSRSSLQDRSMERREWTRFLNVIVEIDSVTMSHRQSLGRRREVQCQFCQRFYQKKEHLIRHERTHTGHKPFTCGVCQKCFARHDSLARHKRLHTDSNTSRIEERSADSADGAGESSQGLPDVPDINGLNESLPATAVDQSHIGGDPSVLRPPLPSVEYDGIPLFQDTDDFYRYLLSTPPGWPTSLPTDISPQNLSEYPGTGTQYYSGDGPADPIEDNSPQALQQMNAMISDMSSNVTKEINARGISSSFLDASLHQFFARFNHTFPILHEATFVLKDCGPFLLLNMVAIGSLFFGSNDAVSKGEFLWRLAQTAAATSWGDVFEGKFAAYRSQAAQIVTTALLGQTYAMLSKSRRLRTLCQTLHGLPFSWARQFGMYDLQDFARDAIPEPTADVEEKTSKWKAWVSTEVQRRTVLGLYIIDAQLARYAGAAPVGKHVTNPLKLASRESIFQARTADEWVMEMRQHWKIPTTFREVFLLTFQSHAQLPQLESQLSASVLLEGFQAILSEHGDANGSALGIPPIEQIIDASLRLRETYLVGPSLSIENTEHLLRWHAFCLDLATDAVLLCQRLCINFGTEQKIFSAGRRSPDPIDLNAWAYSADARRALLHAFAIQDLAESLTLGRACPAHLPASIFAAATIYCAFSRFGYSTVTPPEHIDWDATWGRRGSDEQNCNGGVTPEADSWSSDSYRFVMGDYLVAGKTRSRNLRCSLLVLQMMLQMIASQWGISHDMLTILSAWISTTA